MREIKFRVWDKELKEMFIPTYPDEVQFDNGSPHWANCEQFVPMQFTGLKDKNGKEVYEGDIVIVDNVAEEDRIMVMLWNPRGSFNLCPKDRIHEFPKRSGYYAPECSCQIIGNKFDNPELCDVVYTDKDCKLNETGGKK